MVIATLSMFLSGCLNHITGGDQSGPLIPQVFEPSARAQDRSSDRKIGGGDGVVIGARENPAAQPERAEVFFGSGKFTQTSKPNRGAEITGAGDVELNFSEANIREVAQTVLGDILGQNVVIDTGIDQRITLRTSRPLKKSDLVFALETTLSAAGLALIKEGEVYRVLSSAKARAAGKSLTLANRGTVSAGYQITVVRLEHLAPSQMAKILEPLAPEKSLVKIDDPRNILILSATGPEMKALLETVEIFDVSPLKGMSFGYFKLQNARTGQIVPELKNLIKAYQNQSGFHPPQIVPVERLNALLVFTSQPGTLKLMQTWVRRLDQEKSESETQVFIYRVKNRKAKELATLLSSLFLGDSDAGTSKAIDTPPDTRTVDVTSPNDDPLRPSSFSNDPLRNSSGGEPVRTSLTAEPPRANTRLQGRLRVVADPDNNSLLIRATPLDYQSVQAALMRLDTVPPLVMVEVTIAEVALNDSLKYGVEWFFKKGKSDASFSGLDAGKVVSQFPGFSYFFNAVDIQVVLNAVAGVTNVKILSSPKVMVMDNKTATLQIGDQVPIITSSSQSVTAPDAPVIQTVQYYNTGVILKVTPQVNSGGLISMDVSQEVSNVAEKESRGTASPTIQQRKISSAIAIQSGEAIVLGGLIRESKSVSNTGLPLLSKLPNVGDIFSTNDNKAERTELVVIISPKVVWDRSDARDVSDELKSRMQGIFGPRSK